MSEITKTIDELIEIKAPSHIPDDGNNDNKKELSHGEKLVGITFNPSGDDKVNKAKQLCAELANLVIDEENRTDSFLHTLIYRHTLGEILNAQMCAVKLLTLKY